MPTRRRSHKPRTAAARRPKAGATRLKDGAAAPFDDDAMQARLLYRDSLMLIIDKPAGLPVHAGPGGGPTLEDCFEGLRFGLPERPALAHRLDRDTSGCLVLGRHRKALRRLGHLFASGQVSKLYWAIVEGKPPAAEGTIDLPLAKRSNLRGWWMKPEPSGQPAITDYQLLGTDGTQSWLALRPRTGRTHQIRVHCAALGCPVAGDSIYGVAPRGSALLLHARAIAVPLYPERPPVSAEAPPPPSMEAALRACGWRPEAEPAGERQS
jgi:tRNA pseudouridine32 synthase/23S rRNA pseudouridine746 synthase